MYRIAKEVLKFIDKTMETWRVELTKKITEVKIHKGIFQGNALSSLLFVITTIPLKHLLRKYTVGYKLS